MVFPNLALRYDWLSRFKYILYNTITVWASNSTWKVKHYLEISLLSLYHVFTQPCIEVQLAFKSGFSVGNYQLVVWLPIGSLFANHNTMVFCRQLYQDKGTVGCFMVLGGDISTAAGCYHVFGGSNNPRTGSAAYHGRCHLSEMEFW